MFFIKMKNIQSYIKSIEFLKSKFNEYYKGNNSELPNRFGRREFAFMFFNEKGMLRHLSFKKKNDFEYFLQKKTPAHVYYSSAYYKYPDENIMAKKEWMGAELIFDLDSDHLPNAEKLSYEKQLEIVKKEFYKLVDDFLLGDFGFANEDLDLYFSGGRGYHCHVMSPKVLKLDSSERREIVDYITGRDLRNDDIIKDHVVEKVTRGDRCYPKTKRLEMPKPDEGGWRGRISRAIVDMLQEFNEMETEDAIKKLQSFGHGKKVAEKIVSTLSKEKIKRIETGWLDQSAALRNFFLKEAKRQTMVHLSKGETDEPVTCDIKRLIRLPSSLHGKTGFKVVKIGIDDLKDFDPLTDAVVFSNNNEVKINVLNETNIKLQDNEYKLKAEENTLVPEHVAVFMVARGLANII
ncbi:DNA primase small subunit [Thermoplasmatales archaeon SCGC AB-539-N05]|nr:DNA primase small subunit [Thermoplasmatales archaeon SCGC AB-539-N05]